MSRLDIKTPSKAQTVVDNLYRDVERRIAASPPGLCPVDMSLTFLQLCHAQTCGKCVPCRIGLGQLTKLIGQVLDGEADMSTLDIIEKTARSIVNTADCAIGRDAARLVVDGLKLDEVKTKAMQTFLNIGVVTGLLPATGISLPFFSYGGTALMIQLAEMGIVLSVSRQMKPTKAG